MAWASVGSVSWSFQSLIGNWLATSAPPRWWRSSEQFQQQRLMAFPHWYQAEVIEEEQIDAAQGLQSATGPPLCLQGAEFMAEARQA